MSHISIRKCRASGRRKKKSLGTSTLESDGIYSSSNRTIFNSFNFRNDSKLWDGAEINYWIDLGKTYSEAVQNANIQDVNNNGIKDGWKQELTRLDWIVRPTDSITISNMDVTIRGNLIVEGTLNLYNVNVKMNSDGASTDKIEVLGTGTLNAASSSFSAFYAEQPYDFVIGGAARISDCDITGLHSDLQQGIGGLRIQSDNVELLNTGIESQIGLTIDGASPRKLSGLRIKSEAIGINLINAQANIEYTTMDLPAQTGTAIQASGGSDAVISNSALRINNNIFNLKDQPNRIQVSDTSRAIERLSMGIRLADRVDNNMLGRVLVTDASGINSDRTLTAGSTFSLTTAEFTAAMSKAAQVATMLTSVISDAISGQTVTHIELADTDGDGLDLSQELQQGTSPNNPDTDYDGLWDGCDITTPDGVSHRGELSIHTITVNGVSTSVGPTDPNNPDTDHDLLPDGWELQYGLNPDSRTLAGRYKDMHDDLDSDDLINLGEYAYGYGGAVSNFIQELVSSMIDVNNLDSKIAAIGVPALPRYYQYDSRVYPNIKDSDFDGLGDAIETGKGASDSVSSHQETVLNENDVWMGTISVPTYMNNGKIGTFANNLDTDGDGIPDGTEVNGWLIRVYDENPEVGQPSIIAGRSRTVCTDPFSSNPSIDDPDNDGLTTGAEYKIRSNPYWKNTDGESGHLSDGADDNPIGYDGRAPLLKSYNVYETDTDIVITLTVEDNQLVKEIRIEFIGEHLVQWSTYNGEPQKTVTFTATFPKSFWTAIASENVLVDITVKDINGEYWYKEATIHIASVFEQIVNTITSFFTWLYDLFSTVANTVINAIKAGVEAVIRVIFEPIINAIKTAFNNWWNPIYEKIKEYYLAETDNDPNTKGDITAVVNAFFGGLGFVQPIVDFLQRAIDFIKPLLNLIKDAINYVVNLILDIVRAIFPSVPEKTFNVNDVLNVGKEVTAKTLEAIVKLFTDVPPEAAGVIGVLGFVIATLVIHLDTALPAIAAGLSFIFGTIGMFISILDGDSWLPELIALMMAGGALITALRFPGTPWFTAISAGWCGFVLAVCAGDVIFTRPTSVL